MIKKIQFSLALLCLPAAAWSATFTIGGDDVAVSMPEEYRPVLSTAIEILGRDVRNYTGDTVAVVGSGSRADICVRIDPDAIGYPQGFRMEVMPDGTLSIKGHDSHGAAYGIIELTRIMGVSPWEWWADASPRRRSTVELPAGYVCEHHPSVEYRGIFINDEDWGLMQWSSLNYEPWYMPGRIGPQTNARIFELMLRLRANYYWPAMHECTQPFFFTPGNREMAEKYGIYIGGSHCEPMASSTAVEWGRRGKGEYDYVNNSDNVYSFWEERLKEVAGQEILYTVGMRGVHDGAMNGAKTIDEQKAVLARVFKDQRGLLARHVNEDVTKVPQVFIPYKEVLNVYKAGLEVPDDITLMWTDDNYGYIRHFPTDTERARKGGNGIYYHVSYWGRPHDYLWLGTISPGLVYQQMKTAYDRGIRKMWVLNVGDIKPSEYQIELFMDMAWDMDCVAADGVKRHMANFLSREFGDEIGRDIFPVLDEHYRLAHIRRPEFMGNTRVEEWEQEYSTVKDMPWTESYLNDRLDDYKKISDRAQEIDARIPDDRKDTYFQLVKYPVQGAAEMNKKHIYAQFARHGKMDWHASDCAYDSIVALTRIYNTGIHNRGKWHRIMDFQPRRLPVYEPVDRSSADAPMLAASPSPVASWNAVECSEGSVSPWEMLGYEGKAAGLAKGEAVGYDFGRVDTDSVGIEVCMVPTHPVDDGGKLRFALSVDGKECGEFAYETYDRSEEWKENVLNNRAVRKAKVAVDKKKKKHRLHLKALDDGVVLDRMSVYAD